MKSKNLLCSLIIVACAHQYIQAQDRVFAQTYQTNVLPSGIKELEYWSTLRSGRTNFYNAIDQRLELELGLGGKLQTAFYLNIKSESFSVIEGIEKTTTVGFSNEWKYKMTDPVANRVGSALYFEVGFDGEEIEFEGKIILDKKFGNNLVAFNGVSEYEIGYHVVNGVTTTSSESPFEFDFAYLHFLNNHIGIGLEARNHNEVSEDEGWENSVWYAGPTFHFNGANWFINLNVQPQLFNARKEEGSTQNLELNTHEKLNARVLISFNF